MWVRWTQNLATFDVRPNGRLERSFPHAGHVERAVCVSDSGASLTMCDDLLRQSYSQVMRLVDFVMNPRVDACVLWLVSMRIPRQTFRISTKIDDLDLLAFDSIMLCL